MYFINSINPEDDKEYYLTLGENTLFASKVNEGESIKTVVDREIPDLTGSREYTLLNIKEHDSAKDRHGNELKRLAISLYVPYFDPDNISTKHVVSWQAFN